jgi:hypothetical protein
MPAAGQKDSPRIRHGGMNTSQTDSCMVDLPVLIGNPAQMVFAGWGSEKIPQTLEG